MEKPMEIADLLASIRIRNLRLFVVGDRMACGPTALLTDDIRAGLREHKHALLPVLVTWGAATGWDVLHLLFEAVPPAAPFRLDEVRWVSDPVHFYVALYDAIQAGPGGARARTGALQKDLRLVHERYSLTSGNSKDEEEHVLHAF